MKTPSAISLNEEQQAAVNTRDGVWCVLAGPGSGKSTVLVQRYLKMLSEGVPFNDMLNLTFTHGAAKNMATRAGVLDAQNVFRTFHSFALDMLKNERDRLPFKTCDTIIPVDLQDYTLLFDLVKIYPALSWREIQSRITGWKCVGVSPQQAMEETAESGIEYVYALAYQDYETKCREQGWLDFASLMDEAVKMLEVDEDVRNKYQRKYIAVDEAQDTDAIQFRLLQLLFKENLFAVGDFNQAIYEWRGARPDKFADFVSTFPHAKTLYLGTNHRSDRNLVNFFKEILPVDNGLASHMQTYNPPGKDFTITYYDDADAEAEGVLKQAIKDPSHTAIIARTNRQLFVFQRLCAMRGIKYNFLGKKDFFETNEVKKLLGYAKDARSNQPANAVLADLIARHNMLHIYGQVGRDNPMEASPIENLQAIVKMAAGKGSLKEFLDYLRRLTHGRKSTKALTLSTVHQAKGLEFDIVYIVGAKQGTMPHKDGEGPEEARIFFVAASRAARELHISFWGSLSQYLLRYEARVKDTSLCKTE